MTHHHIHLVDVQNSLQNYIFIVEDTRTKDAVIIDPTESQIVLNYCYQHQLKPKQIWITHHHHDHTGGIAEMIAQFPNLPVYAPQLERDKITGVTHGLQHDDQFHFNDWAVDVIETAGHTLGHICYFIDALDVLFCGDTLFVMGCGRVFEGTYQQMYHSLNRLSALPPRTKVYCTHEYTQSNVKFALYVEPDNVALQQRALQIDELRKKGLPTVPSTIAEELETNPFLRAMSVEQFQQLRMLKDNF